MSGKKQWSRLNKTRRGNTHTKGQEEVKSLSSNLFAGHGVRGNCGTWSRGEKGNLL